MKLTFEWGDGRRETISANPDLPILDAAEHAGIALPFGCRRGVCSTCTGRLLEGRVHHVRQPRCLKPRHLAQDYVLLCSAEPRSDCHIEVGAGIQSALVTNPWK